MRDDRLADLGVHEAVVEIKSGQPLNILLELLGLQDARVRNEAQQGSLVRGHHADQFFGREGFISFKRNGADINPVVFLDVQNQDEILLAVFFQTVGNFGVVVAFGVVKRLDFLQVLLDVFRIDALPHLDAHGFQNVVLVHLLVADQADFRNEAFFDHAEGQHLACGLRRDVGADVQKIPHLEDGFDVVADVFLIQRISGPAFDFLPDGVRADLAVARDFHSRDFIQEARPVQNFPLQRRRQRSGARVALSLNRNGRQDFPFGNVDDLRVDVQGFAELHNAAGDDVIGAQRFSRRGRFLRVGGRAARFEAPRGFYFHFLFPPEFRKQAVVNRRLQFGASGKRVNLKGENAYFFGAVRPRLRRKQKKKNRDEEPDRFEVKNHKFSRRADRFCRTSFPPAVCCA